MNACICTYSLCIPLARCSLPHLSCVHACQHVNIRIPQSSQDNTAPKENERSEEKGRSTHHLICPSLTQHSQGMISPFLTPLRLRIKMQESFIRSFAVPIEQRISLVRRRSQSPLLKCSQSRKFSIQAPSVVQQCGANLREICGDGTYE